MKRIAGTVLIAFSVLSLAGCGNNFAKLETELKEKAAKYYEKNMKDRSLFPGPKERVQQKVTLKALEVDKVDIKNFIDKKCDKEDSYALVVYATDEKGKQKGDYTVENHLTCGDYKTK